MGSVKQTQKNVEPKFHMEEVVKALHISEENEKAKALREIATRYIEEGKLSEALVTILFIPKKEEKSEAVEKFVNKYIQKGMEDEEHFPKWFENAAAIAACYLFSEEKKDDVRFTKAVNYVANIANKLRKNHSFGDFKRE
jgi:vacuolar-type H+-ATPase subunit F/Vma7